MAEIKIKRLLPDDEEATTQEPVKIKRLVTPEETLATKTPTKISEIPSIGEYLLGPRYTAFTKGLGKGLTGGLSNYGAAAGRVIGGMLPGGTDVGYDQALRQVREQNQAYEEAYPRTYTLGDVAGTLSQSLAGPSKVIPQAAYATGQGMLKKYTESPETTIGDALTAGLGAGAGSLLIGSLGQRLQNVFGKVGEKEIRSRVANLIDDQSPSGLRKLEEVFGPAYKELSRLKEAARPTTDKAADILKWEKDYEVLGGGLKEFAERYVKNPSLFQRYTSGGQVTPYTKEVVNAAKTIKKELLGEAAESGAGQVIRQLSGSAGVGALGGALTASAFGQDPYMGALLGGSGSLSAAAAGKWLGATHYLNPSRGRALSSLGQLAGGGLGYGYVPEIVRSRGPQNK